MRWIKNSETGNGGATAAGACAGEQCAFGAAGSLARIVAATPEQPEVSDTLVPDADCRFRGSAPVGEMPDKRLAVQDTVDRLSPVERRLSDPNLLPDLADYRTSLGVAQSKGDLSLGRAFPWHLHAPLIQDSRPKIRS